MLVPSLIIVIFALLGLLIYQYFANGLSVSVGKRNHEIAQLLQAANARGCLKSGEIVEAAKSHGLRYVILDESQRERFEDDFAPEATHQVKVVLKNNLFLAPPMFTTFSFNDQNCWSP